MKRFVYLVQGKASLVSRFLELRLRPRADALFLTYDEPLQGATFLPNSSWAQGRNLLLREALANGHDYTYYVFLDDDVIFERGNWDVFERRLLHFRPAVGVAVNTNIRYVPLGVQLRHWYLPFVRCQPFRVHDEQLIAYHRDVVHDALVVPYQECFDDISWWWACHVEQILIQTFYFPHVLLFNDVFVRNELHRDYPRKKPDNELRGWLSRQFAGPYRRPARYAILLYPRHELGLLRRHPAAFVRGHARRAYWLLRALTYRKKATYRLPRQVVAAALKPDSELFAQYQALRRDEG